MIHSEIINDEVYVYIDVSLLYKKWLNSNQSALFNETPSFVYDKHTLFTITADGVKDNITGKIK